MVRGKEGGHARARYRSLRSGCVAYELIGTMIDRAVLHVMREALTRCLCPFYNIVRFIHHQKDTICSFGVAPPIALRGENLQFAENSTLLGKQVANDTYRRILLF